MTETVVTLCAFTRAHLAATGAWFGDPDTRRYLGGREWLTTMLERADHVVGEEFRGAVQTGVYRYVARREGRAVGYVDCGTFDRCTLWRPELISELADVSSGR